MIMWLFYSLAAMGFGSVGWSVWRAWFWPYYVAKEFAEQNGEGVAK